MSPYEIGLEVRTNACRFAAQVMEGRGMDDSISSRLWALTVFFETYIRSGAAGTQEEFGPQERSAEIIKLVERLP